MDVNAIEQWSRHALPVTLDLPLGAAAVAFRMTVETTRTRIHRGDEHDVRRKSHGPGGARNHRFSILQRLAQHLQRAASEFRQLIEEKHTMVSQTHLARRGIGRSAEQTDIGNRVVRRAERANGDKIEFAGEQTANAMDLGCLDGLLQCQRRHDGRNPFGQHALPGARGTKHQEIVATSHGDLEGALYPGLAFHVRKIDVEMLVAVENGIQVRHRGGNLALPVQELETLPQIAHAMNGQTLHHRGLGGIFLGNDKHRPTAAARFERDR